jgi:O-antigen/teichoic acid export membrane protein
MVLRSVITLVMGAIFLQQGLGLLGALAGVAAGNILAVAITAGLAARHLLNLKDRDIRQSVNELQSRHENYLLTTVTFGLILVVLYSDTLVARLFIGSEAAGRYAVVAVASRTIYFAPSALHSMIVPLVASRTATGQRTRQFLVVGLAFNAITTLPLVALFSIAPQFVLSLLFGETYAIPEVARLLPRYGIATALLSVSVFLAYYCMARRQRSYLLALVAGIAVMLVNLGLNHETAEDLVQALLAGNGVMVVAIVLVTLVPLERFRRPNANRICDKASEPPHQVGDTPS